MNSDYVDALKHFGRLVLFMAIALFLGWVFNQTSEIPFLFGSTLSFGLALANFRGFWKAQKYATDELEGKGGDQPDQS